MARSVIKPVSVGATAPEALLLMQQRLSAAEEQAEALVRDLGSLGVTREQLLMDPLDKSCSPRPVSPLRVQRALAGGWESMLWRQCEALVSRVCRLESLLHTLKLTTFRLETERELNPSHSARLREQLSALQEQCEEEQRSSRREVMRLQEQLQQACLGREEGQKEVLRLREALELSSSSKIDVAMAADELKLAKVQMSQRLIEIKEQLAEEISARVEAQKSQSALLQRVEEMGRAVERERGQVEALQTDCHALRVDRQLTHQDVEEKAELIQHLEKECQHLRDQSGLKECLVSELTTEIKSIRLALQKQQQENSRLIKDGGELRAAADKVQVLNEQLESQCSGLSAALRSLTVENTRLQTEHQNSIKAERERVTQRLQEQDLLLDAARREIQSELQTAVSERHTLQRELESLKADHAKMLQHSAVAQETAVTQQEMLERTIERLRGELDSAAKEVESMKRQRDSMKTEMCTVVSKLETDTSMLESQLREAKLEVSSISSTLQKQQDENRGLMGKMAAIEHQQNAQRLVEQMLQELTDSKSKLAYERGKLQAQVQQLEEELLAERSQQRQQNSSLEHRYTQVCCELRSLKASCVSMEQQLKQTHAALQMKESALALLVSERDHAMRETLAVTAELSSLQQQHSNTGEVALTLENVLASHYCLQQKTETLQTELGGREQELHTLRIDRLQGQRDINRLQAEVEKLQGKLTLSERNHQDEVLQKALEAVQRDNKKLAQSLEEALLANRAAHDKLQQSQEHHHCMLAQRKAELNKAMGEIGQLNENIDALNQQLSQARDSRRKASQRELTKLKRAYEEASARSGDLSSANRELRERVGELEKLVSNQKSQIKAQRQQLKQHVASGGALGQSQRVKELEAEIKRLERLKDEYQRKSKDQAQVIQQVRNDMESLQSELRCLSSTQQGELQAERQLTESLKDKCQRLDDLVRQLREERDEAHQKLREVSLESEQISENLEEAHSWFRSRFDSLRSEAEQSQGEPQANADCSSGTVKISAQTPPTQDRSKVGCSGTSDSEMERWASTLQRWETKRELARIASGYKFTGRTPT